jgi:hypothetical protein
MKKILLILFLSMGLNLLAQQTDVSEETKHEKIDVLKIGFITEKLALTSKEAELFWPIYNKFEQDIKKVRKKQRELTKAFKLKTKPSEQEADKYINEQMVLKQNEIDAVKKYIPEFKKVLPTTKVAKLLSIEQEFKIQLLKKIKDKRHKE